jgi:hypothetical protein
VRFLVTKGLSVLRACVLVQFQRATFHYQARPEAAEAEIAAIAQTNPRYGYRRAWALLRRKRNVKRCLETIREYARKRLAERGDEATLRRRHAMHFLDIVEQTERHRYGRQAYAWVERLAADYDNLRAALVWSTDATGDWRSRYGSSQRCSSSGPVAAR